MMSDTVGSTADGATEDASVGDESTVTESAALAPADVMAEWQRLAANRSAAAAAHEERIAPLLAEFEQQVGPLDRRLAELEDWFKAHAETSGQDAFASDAGTVTIGTRETPKISDPDAFFTWAASSNNVGLLQKRISVTEYRQFVKDNPGDSPPGVTVEQTRSVKFKPSS